jgi:hypothetical protein
MAIVVDELKIVVSRWLRTLSLIVIAVVVLRRGFEVVGART